MIRGIALTLLFVSSFVRAADSNWFGFDLGYGMPQGSLNYGNTASIPVNFSYHWVNDRWAAGFGFMYAGFSGELPTPDPMNVYMAESIFTRLLGARTDTLIPYISLFLGIGKDRVFDQSELSVAAGLGTGIYVNAGPIYIGTGARVDYFPLSPKNNFTGMLISWQILELRLIFGGDTSNGGSKAAGTK